VTDVEANSRWRQRLLGCQSAHGGSEYERLESNGLLIMQLHSFEVDHHHVSIGDPEDNPYGNGVLLWFEVDDFDDALARAAEMKAEVVMARHRNPPTGDGGPLWQNVTKGGEDYEQCANSRSQGFRLSTTLSSWPN